MVQNILDSSIITLLLSCSIKCTFASVAAAVAIFFSIHTKNQGYHDDCFTVMKKQEKKSEMQITMNIETKKKISTSFLL